MPKCNRCAEEFEPVRYWQKYCSVKCRYDAWDENNPRVRRPAVTPDPKTLTNDPREQKQNGSDGFAE